MDADGISDTHDNCVQIPNPNQEDFDEDKLGDLCDTDEDKLGDLCDTDDDNDGIFDEDE